jgi:predicted ATP-grasp superfamily ATP-dependent carboligase
MGDAPGVLIVDAGERSAVAACESLARAGYRVGTASSQRRAPAEWSRFSQQRFPLPNPRHDAGRFAQRLAAICGENAYATLLACSEGSLRALSTHRDFFDGVTNLGLPSTEVMEKCTSKAELASAALAAGLSTPDTELCQTREEAHAAAARFGFPVMCKPRRTVFVENDEVRHFASAVVPSREALEAGLDEAGLPCLVQRRETGSVVSFAGVMAGGSLLAAAFSRYLRTWPPEAGPVSFSASLAPTPQLTDAVTQLVAGLGWQGIFELEMIDRGDGDYAAIDFNPRIYGSLALAVRAGAPLPAVWCDWLLKGKEVHCQARPEVRYRWDDAELRNALALASEGHPLRAASILRPHRDTAHAYFRWYDPAPGVVRALKLLRRPGARRA